jgi:mono/diheme cytochrome c family protein
MRCAPLLACLLTVAFAGCGGSDGNHAATIATIPSGTKRATAAPEQIAAGGRVVTDSGCLACHQIGNLGQSGPGSNLTGIGERRTPAEIRRGLLNAPAPMPPYNHLSRDRLDALVAYLSSLRDACPDGSDCG